MCINHKMIKIQIKMLTSTEKEGNVKTTSDEVRAIYPCFDIIPSKLVTGIVTPDGVRR